MFWYVSFIDEIPKRAWFALFDGVLAASLNTRLYIIIENIVSNLDTIIQLRNLRGSKKRKVTKNNAVVCNQLLQPVIGKVRL